ncbi:hypothetical protein TrLO_g11691 [Triparma laevis f. longispina]|uniref:Uncharacterized protein n=1 Tax=Triparma laevis f. longispina TaxID=1714387 RepID=A0A9W7C8L6_9STRA|nr:hypothetical protein TrLO_g11691 [Triparma laevis f. longispina]
MPPPPPLPLLSLSLLLVFLLGTYESYLQYGPLISLLETLWVCSLSILSASLSTYFLNPDLLAVTVINTFTGHSLWCLDTVSLLINKLLYNSNEGFLNMADYGGLNGITLWSFLAVSHHLWFIPTTIYTLRTHFHFHLKFKHWLYSYAFVSILSLITLWITPVECIKYGKSCISVNINMCEGWWGLDEVDFLHYFDRERCGNWGWNGNGMCGAGRWVFSNAVYSMCNLVGYRVLKSMINNSNEKKKTK